MVLRMRKVLVGACTLLVAVAAHAADFSVGRVDITFAESGWKEVPLPDQSHAYGGEKDGALSVQAKLYVLEPSAYEGQTLVLVSANSQGLGGGRGGYMTYNPDCKSDRSIFREGNEGFGSSFMHCLTVTPQYTSESVFKALAPQIVELQKTGMVSVQRPVFTVWSLHAISTGSFVDVRVFVLSPLGSEAAAVSEVLPKGVPPEHVAWGRRLQSAVKDSVYSLTGRLTMPAVKPASTPAGSSTGGG